MTKNFEVKAINEDEVKSFLLDFYGVDSIDSIVHRELSGLAPLNNFKYVDEYVWGIEYLLGSNTNNQEQHHVLVFINKEKHEIAAFIDYWDPENNPNADYKEISFVDLNNKYSDEKMKQILPEIFDEFATRLSVHKIVDVVQNEHDNKIGMQNALTKDLANKAITL